MSVLDDFLGVKTTLFGDKNIVDLWQTYNKEKLEIGLAKSKNTIEELKASTEMLRTQNEALLAQAQAAKSNSAFGNIDFKKYLPYALAAGGLYLAYRLIK